MDDDTLLLVVGGVLLWLWLKPAPTVVVGEARPEAALDSFGIEGTLGVQAGANRACGC
jgi:hypothetical protein